MIENVPPPWRSGYNGVAFRVKGRGFKSTHSCSHTVQKPSISPRLFCQCTLNICFPFTIYPLPKQAYTNKWNTFCMPLIHMQNAVKIITMSIKGLLLHVLQNYLNSFEYDPCTYSECSSCHHGQYVFHKTNLIVQLDRL